MRRFRPRRPSGATLIASAALFVALGGTGYAAFNVPKNSVGTQQLKNKAVTSSKIKNGAVTASKINTSGLTVPTASHASSADNATNAGHASNSDNATNANHADTAGGAPPTGGAGGDLTGSYPNPSIGAGAVNSSKLADGSVTTSKLGTIPAAGVFNSANESIANNIFPVLTFNTNRYDIDGLHNTTSNTSRLTAPVAGIYDVTASVTWSSGAGTYRYLGLQRNGGTFLATSQVPPAGGTAFTQQTVAAQVELNAGDYIEVVVAQDSGAALNVVAQAERSPEFQMTWIAPG